MMACDSTFNPWQENDQYYFSIYGYLDASADTQWVRVMPVREDFYLQPEPSEATVTFEHLQSGETVAMNDSLVGFAHGVYAYNYWTTMDLQPEQTYRITATGPDENSSFVEVTLPGDFPTPVIRSHPFEERDEIFIVGVDRLADLQTIYYVKFSNSGGEYVVPLTHLQDTLRLASGGFMIPINREEEIERLESELGNRDTWTIIHQQVFIASPNSDFHFFPSIDEKIVALPEGISNVLNGVGYLAGIVSKTIPFESCTGATPQDIIPCELEPYPWYCIEHGAKCIAYSTSSRPDKPGFRNTQPVPLVPLVPTYPLGYSKESGDKRVGVS